MTHHEIPLRKPLRGRERFEITEYMRGLHGVESVTVDAECVLLDCSNAQLTEEQITRELARIGAHPEAETNGIIERIINTIT